MTMTVAELVKMIYGCYMIRIECVDDLLYEGLVQDFRKHDRSGKISERKVQKLRPETYSACKGLYEGCITICVCRD